MAGQELTSPKWFCNGSKQDFIEPMKYIIKKYQPSRLCVIGVSLGASVVAHVLTEIKVDGAVLLNTPINLPKVMHQIKKGFGGILNKSMSDEIRRTLTPHQDN